MTEHDYVAEMESQLKNWKAALEDLGERALEKAPPVTTGISYPAMIENLETRLEDIEERLDEIRIAERAGVDAFERKEELDNEKEDFERLMKHLKDSLQG